MLEVAFLASGFLLWFRVGVLILCFSKMSFSSDFRVVGVTSALPQALHSPFVSLVLRVAGADGVASAHTYELSLPEFQVCLCFLAWRERVGVSETLGARRRIALGRCPLH